MQSVLIAVWFLWRKKQLCAGWFCPGTPHPVVRYANH